MVPFGLLDIPTSTVISEIQGPANECYQTREDTTSPSQSGLMARRSSSFDASDRVCGFKRDWFARRKSSLESSYTTFDKTIAKHLQV